VRPLEALLFPIAAVLIISCSDKDQKATKKNSKVENTSLVGDYQVIDSFSVGKNVFVRSLSSDIRTNTVWVGTSVGALNINSQTSSVRQTYTRDNGLANEYVFATYIGSDSSTWFGTNGGGVSHLRDAKWETYFPMHGLADYWVYSFAEQKNTALWIGTWAGLSRLDYQTGEFKTYIKELVNEWIYGLDVDSKNRVWIGTEGGVNMYDGSKWHVWTHQDGLGAPNSRNLSFSTNTGLGTRSRHDLSVLVGGEDSYNPNYIFCVKVTPDDNVWAGTWGGGVSVYDGKQWSNLNSEDGLVGDIVYSIEIDQKGVMWFGTNKGLSAYDGNNWQTFTIAEGLLDSHVYALAVTSDNKIWIGSKNGVAVVN